ncbi:hypothetical protein CSTERTH_10570 [Thermoclostridium stercorarium subsp. thermolacticum DSM 2910]|uniref:Serpin domain-containing protein n=1 Tax=Thermoclostridium stercorarium subsp. thermolacticum DSM 2910 TaxID=1121336 RepID=A0A1B1YFB6_THEST|nr:serpin family protein [Thermoclostridium stercorarium]ANW99440.1 hypothetical protein CSTERTH_10570 [Thermoclostridium stercorarium subsp. thermolacticum DSM 2910]
MKKNALLVLMFILIIFSGCTGGGNVTDTTLKPESGETAGTTVDEKSQPSARVSDANKIFSWELFKALNAEESKQETFISPFSVSAVLMMAYNGAEGSTREAMAKAMHYGGMSVDELNSEYRNLLNRLNNIDEKVKLEIANSIWIRDEFNVKPDFIDVNKNYLFSDVRSLDFTKPDAAFEINRWVSEKTQNRIQSVIDPPIADDVMMYLINAIYFKGEWKNAFDKNNTGEADFYSYDGVTDKVQMMRKTDTFALAELEECSAVALPYGDEKVAMAVILPKKDINKFISNFDGEKWNELVKSFKTVNDLRLEIPKFRMEYGVKELNKALASLGMGEVFSKNADFGGIAEDICMDSVFHKAVVEVNEEGTEAVAATSVIIMTTSLEEPKTFIANRPFVFVIYDTEEGNILFIGKKLYGDR